MSRKKPAPIVTVLEGEALLAARRVVREQVIHEVESLVHDGNSLDTVLEVRDLSWVITAVGDVGWPVDTCDGRLDAQERATLVTAARWQDVLSEDSAEHRWNDETPGVAEGRAIMCSRAADGRRVLEALGVERGNPAELADALERT